MKIIILSSLILSATLVASPIVHEFKNPSFSGKGQGAHYLTIENQEHSRKKEIEDALEAARKAGKLLGLEASKVRMSIDPFEREEKLVEIIPAGADLGIYEDVPIAKPCDDLEIINTYVDLPSLDFPSYDEASNILVEEIMASFL